MKVIADLTKCFPNTHEDTISCVLEFCRERNVPYADLQFFGRPDQAVNITEGGFNWQTVPGDRVQVALAVRAALSRLCAYGQNGDIWLLSYDANVLRLASDFWHGARVSPVPLGAVRFSVGGFNRSSPPGRAATVWAFEQSIPLHEALEVLVRVLQNRGSSSIGNHVKSTELRPAMAAIDPRFLGNGMQTRTAGMISRLIAIAEERQIISVDRTALIHNPLIWLKAAQSPIAQAHPGTNFAPADTQAAVPPATAPTPVLPQAAAVQAAGAPPAAPPLGAPPPTVPQAAVPEAAGPPPAVQQAAVPQAPRASVWAAGGVDSPHRSRRLEKEYLKPKGMGPYTDARLAMYDAIEGIVGTEAVGGGQRLTFDSLIDAATVRAREVLKVAGKDTDEKPQPWSSIQTFLQRLLTRAEALLDENERPIAAGWSSRLKTVKSLANDWRTKADGEIVLSLITDADDISEDDASNLARILYHKNDLDSRAKALRAVAYLIDSGRAIEAVDGGKRFLRPSGPNGQPEASGQRTASDAVAPAPTRLRLDQGVLSSGEGNGCAASERGG